MDSGANKGLFTLITVVIFGIFLSISYWLLQDSLKGVLADVLDKTSQSVDSKTVFGGNVFPDSYFTQASTLTNFGARSFTTKSLDLTTVYNGSNAMKVTFNGDGRVTTFANDFVFYLPDEFNNAKVGDTVTIIFFAKADTPLTLKTRLGGDLFNSTNISSKDLGTEWQEVRIDLPVTHNDKTNYPCAVMWVETPGTVWYTNLSMYLN